MLLIQLLKYIYSTKYLLNDIINYKNYIIFYIKYNIF